MANKNNIIRREQEGIEFFTVEETGESGMSHSGLARLCGVTRQAMDDLLKNAVAGQTRSKWLKGLQGADYELQVSGYKNATPIKAEVCAQVIKHYAFTGNETAQYSMEKFTEIAVTTWIRDITGWQQKPTRRIGAYADRVSEGMKNSKNIPAGYWSVFLESAKLLIYVEDELGLPVDRADLLDGSVGIRWANYREGKRWAGDRVKYKYTFPDGRTVNPWAYGDSELIEFRRWLDNDYRPNALPGYLHAKYGALVKA